MYSDQLLDHFEHPRNVGEIEHPEAQATVENPACGDIMYLSLRVRDGRIAQACFRTKGCVAAIACGSALTELLRGMKLEDVRSLACGAIVSAVGGLPPASTHASHLAIDALHAALKQL